MITMSHDAATLIRTLVSDSDLPATGGLRLGADPFLGSLAMSLSTEASTSDVVVDQDGALLFLAPIVAARLTDQTLRAQLEDRPAFYLTT